MSKIIYHLFIHNEEIDLRKSLKVGVYSDLGINHSKILVERIKERFVEHSVFPIVSIDDLNYTNFICSTIQLDDISSQRVTIINDYITPNDLLIINAKTKEILSSEPK